MSHVLLVEPDRLLRQQYAQALRHAGHQVIACASGQMAILAADRHTPDVVVLELQLPGHNGVEFLYEFRSYSEWQSVPVVVQSLVAPESLRGIVAMPLLNLAAYLYKPTSSLAKLVDRVDEVLQTVNV